MIHAISLSRKAKLHRVTPALGDTRKKFPTGCPLLGTWVALVTCSSRTFLLDEDWKPSLSRACWFQLFNPCCALPWCLHTRCPHAATLSLPGAYPAWGVLLGVMCEAHHDPGVAGCLHCWGPSLHLVARNHWCRPADSRAGGRARLPLLPLSWLCPHNPLLRPLSLWSAFCASRCHHPPHRLGFSKPWWPPWL